MASSPYSGARSDDSRDPSAPLHQSPGGPLPPNLTLRSHQDPHRLSSQSNTTIVDESHLGRPEDGSGDWGWYPQDENFGESPSQSFTYSSPGNPAGNSGGDGDGRLSDGPGISIPPQGPGALIPPPIPPRRPMQFRAPAPTYSQVQEQPARALPFRSVLPGRPGSRPLPVAPVPVSRELDPWAESRQATPVRTPTVQQLPPQLPPPQHPRPTRVLTAPPVPSAPHQPTVVAHGVQQQVPVQQVPIQQIPYGGQYAQAGHVPRQPQQHPMPHQHIQQPRPQPFQQGPPHFPQQAPYQHQFAPPAPYPQGPSYWGPPASQYVADGQYGDPYQHYLDTVQSRRLPATDKADALTGSSNYNVWASWAKNLIKAEGLYAHIALESEVSRLRESEMPTFPPPATSRVHDPIGAIKYDQWWRKDEVVKYVITSRLEPAIHSSIPQINATTNLSSTAREVWDYLYKTYGAGMKNVTLERWGDVMRKRFSAAKVYDLEAWLIEVRAAYGDMLAAGQHIDDDTILVALSSAIPDVGGLAILARNYRDMVIEGKTIPAIRAFELLDQELKDFVRRNPPPASKSQKSTSNPNTRQRAYCGTCKKTGHETSKCWQPGGAMEGRESEVRASMRPRGPRTASGGAGVAAVTVGRAETAAVAPPHAPDAGGGVATTTNVAAVTIAPEYKEHCLYDGQFAAMCATRSIFPDPYDKMLDSGCTGQIWIDRKAIWGYKVLPEKMKTAAVGPLDTEGVGAVKIRLKGYGADGQDIILNMSNVRYAPTAPCNLISETALQRSGIGIIRAPGEDKATLLFGKSTLWPDVSVGTMRYNNLDFLSAEVIYPPSASEDGDSSTRPDPVPARPPVSALVASPG